MNCNMRTNYFGSQWSTKRCSVSVMNSPLIHERPASSLILRPVIPTEVSHCLPHSLHIKFGISPKKYATTTSAFFKNCLYTDTTISDPINQK
jgi:hypothetical protein